MVIDTSALVAMLGDEPEAQRFEVAVQDDPVPEPRMTGVRLAVGPKQLLDYG